ncbi:4-hydroxy-tetrahydrodipicolinate synthase [Parachlamydia sp. AcF125]|uniref:4-hydroxy-tetrahydrodipicolinate synthase n=1 Tax=Parachlamydia sp. AcF125 TaxID=2795736 RepID=UPI001BC8EB93|nr:4-hydroxy-tetrahydrodipicolinate synthase [Parachlamydia sp. AcF125]MBS4167923.1 4-hydroxy-tetrahydrodipicolinate synthase [Parachlamydia sp. AcF125]
MSLKGTITALITPFTEQLHLDEQGLRENIHFQVKAGVNGILVLGTTGESPTLSSEEQTRIIKIAIQEVKNKIPVMVGVGCNNTQHTVEKAKKAQDLGANALLVVAPYYNKPSQEGIFRHFEALSQQVSLPMYVYNIPGRAGVNIEVATLQRIAALPHIAGIKDAAGNLLQTTDIIQQARKTCFNFHVLCGDDALTLPMISLGAQGVISVVSNLVPEQVSQMVDQALTGRFDLAQESHYKLLALFKAAFIEVNPSPIKTAMQICGYPSGGCRLPLCDLLPENKAKLNQLLHEMDLIKG